MVGARGTEGDLDCTAADAARLLGRAALLPSRFLRLLRLLSLLGTGGERKGCQGGPNDEYSLSFLS
jgi:hypothetical protein